MNKKQMRKELNRMQKVHENTVKRINNLEINIEKTRNVNKELKNVIEEQSLKIEEQSLKIEEQSLKIEEQSLEQEDIKKVQEQQGIDIAALAKALNNLEDKKMFFEDEYAEWEDRFNRLSEFIDQNPDLIGLGIVDRGACQQAMKNAIKSIEHIDEKLHKLHKLIKDIQKFDEFNYNTVIKGDEK